MSLRDKGIDVALWILCFDVLATITWNSLGSPPAAFSFPNADKFLHMGSYFTLTFLLLLVSVWRPGRGPGGFEHAEKVVLGSVAGFGVLIELAQGLIFERTADITDGLANVAGILIAWTLWIYLRRTIEAKR